MREQRLLTPEASGCDPRERHANPTHRRSLSGHKHSHSHEERLPCYLRPKLRPQSAADAGSVECAHTQNEVRGIPRERRQHSSCHPVRPFRASLLSRPVSSRPCARAVRGNGEARDGDRSWARGSARATRTRSDLRCPCPGWAQPRYARLRDAGELGRRESRSGSLPASGATCDAQGRWACVRARCGVERGTGGGYE